MTAIGNSTPALCATAKPCTTCGAHKGLLDFHKSPASRDGRASVCINCTNASKRAQRRAANPEYYKSKLDLANGIRRCSVCRERQPLSGYYTKTSSRCKLCESKAGVEQRLRSNPQLAARRAAVQRGEIHCIKCGVSKAATSEFFHFHKGKAKAPCKECKKASEKKRRAKQAAELEMRRLALPPVTTKPCSCCGVVFEANTKNFYKKLDGLTAQCKACKNAADKAWRANRGDARREQETIRRALWKKARMQSHPLYALQERIRALLAMKIRASGYTKKSRTHEILGCSWEFFKAHIERQFVKGMSWEKMGASIHIDHITPICTAATEQEVIALNHFTNLRPIWAKDNLSKGAQITHLI